MTRNMTPRERVLTTLNRQRPDRAPIDYWAEPCVTERLLRDLGLPDRDALLDRLEVDVRALTAVEPPLRDLPGGMRGEFLGRTLAESQCTGDRGVVPRRRCLGRGRDDGGPGAIRLADTGSVRLQPVERAGARSTRAMHAVRLRRQLRTTVLVRGKEQFYCDLALRPEMAHFMIDKFTAFYCEDLTRALEATDGQIDMVLLLADLGTQQGLMFSKEMLDTFFAPYAARLFAIARQAGVKSMLHSCGSVRDYIPELIDVGRRYSQSDSGQSPGDGAPRIETGVWRSPLFSWRRRYSADATARHSGGGAQEVRTRVGELGPDGGYIVCSTHNLQNDAPTENILAMYDVDARSY